MSHNPEVAGSNPAPATSEVQVRGLIARTAVGPSACLLAVRWRDGTPEHGTLRGGLAWIGIAVGCWRVGGHRELPAAASARHLV